MTKKLALQPDVRGPVSRAIYGRERDGSRVDFPPRRFFRAILLPALLMPFFWSPLMAEAKIELHASVGFDKTFASGSWTPLRVLVENLPDPALAKAALEDLRGEIRATVVGNNGQAIQYTQEIELPAHSRKQIEMTVMLPNSSISVDVELVDRRDRVQARDRVNLNPSSGEDQRRESHVIPTVLLDGDDPEETPAYPSHVGGSINLRLVKSKELPSDPKGYAQVNVLLMRGRISNRLSSDQLAAIEAWVHTGGALIVVTPRAAQELKLDTWLADKAPASIEEARQTTLEALMPGSNNEPILQTIWDKIAPDASVLWATPSGALAPSRRIGLGSITFLAIDPSSLRGSALTTPVGRRMMTLLESLVFAPRPEDLRARHVWSTEDVDQDFSSVEILPNILLVAAVIVMFVLVVGPVNFYVLRKRRRLELAWITIPSLSIFFFLAVYAFGMATKGHDQLFASTEILHLNSGDSKGLLIWTAAQFSPRPQTYRFTSGKGGVMLPLAQYYEPPNKVSNIVGRFAPAMARGGFTADPKKPGIAISRPDHGYDLRNPVGQWTMAYYQGEQPLEIEGKISGRVTLQSRGGIRVEIENKTPAALEDAEVWAGLRCLKLGEIAPQSNVDRVFEPPSQPDPPTPVPIPIPTQPGDDKFPSSAWNSIRGGAFSAYPLLQRQNSQRRCRLLARQRTWVSGVKVDPAPELEKRFSAVEVQLPLSLEGSVTLLTEGSTRGSILSCRVYEYDPRYVTFFANGAAAGGFCSLTDSSFEILISPSAMDTPKGFESGDVTVGYTQGTNALRVSAFNYETGGWEIAPSLNTDAISRNQPKTYHVAVQPRWINPDEGSMRLKLESVLMPSVAGRAPGNPGQNFIAGAIQILSIQGIFVYRGETPTREAQTQP